MKKVLDYIEEQMSIPYNNDTKETYVQRMKDTHLGIAKTYYKLGYNTSMWLSLMYFAMAEDLYGEHWDYLQRRTHDTR